jgi:glycosyltransferase involved in cell wall biosynthesis
MMTTPLVSILIPAYGVAPYIAEALDSVFAQTFSGPFEVVLVNDGSPDTIELEKAIAPYRDRIVYHVQANGGPSAARNTAFRMSSAPLIALLDGDDAYLPGYLQVQTELLAENPDLSLTYGDMETFDGRRLSEMIQQIEPPALESLLRTTATVVNTPTIRRQAIIDAGGWDESSRHCEDYDLWLRIAVQKGKLKRHSHLIARYRVRSDGQTANAPKMWEGRMHAYLKLRENKLFPPALLPLLEQRIAATKGDIALARGKIAFQDRNFSLAARYVSEASSYRHSARLSAIAVLLKACPKLLYGLNRLRA